MGQYFGTDGIRGVANTELTPEFTLGLGRAVVRTLREEGVERPQIVIGRDPRASGHMLEAALASGICSAGGDAILVGVVPTPGIAYLTTRLGASSGAMISASHNPVGDNGLKFFGPTGYKLTDAEEERIEELLQRFDEHRPVGAAIGRVREAHGETAVYIDHLAAAADADCSGLKVVVDCAHGAASEVAPAVLERLGCEVVTICADPDGENINAGCGSTHPEVVAQAVVEHGADLGIAHDGDADRMIAADASGAIVDGDAILAILAEREQRERGLDAVVTTVMTNLGFTQAMDRLGIDVVQTKVGDRYVLEAMREHGHPLGGEQSGHLILTRHATTGDGVLSAVALLSAVADSGKPLAELAGVMTRLPQVLVNVADVDKERLDSADALWEAVADAEAALDGSGRVLVRPSGTEPVVRVMVEADTHERAEETAEQLAEVVRKTLALA